MNEEEDFLGPDPDEEEELGWDYHLYTPEAWVTPSGMTGIEAYIKWNNLTGGYKKPAE